MRIERLDTIPVSVPYTHAEVSARVRRGGVTSVIVRLTTDTGLTGWGESCVSYKLDYSGYERASSCASQTAWALMGLMAAGEVDHPATARGIRYLQGAQQESGLWPEDTYTGGGFPRAFYLCYHGYAKFFPLWALARYRNLKASNTTSVLVGM